MYNKLYILTECVHSSPVAEFTFKEKQIYRVYSEHAYQLTVVVNLLCLKLSGWTNVIFFVFLYH